MRILVAAVVAFQCTRSVFAEPLTVNEISLMLRSGCSSETILNDVSVRHFAEKIDPVSEEQLRGLHASQALIDALKSGDNAASAEEVAQAGQRAAAQKISAQKTIAAQEAAARQAAPRLAQIAVVPKPTPGPLSGAIRGDVRYGSPFNLQRYGGPKVQLLIWRQQDTVNYLIEDYEHQVARAVVDAHEPSFVRVGPFIEDLSGPASAHIVYDPTRTRRSITIEGGGIEVADHRQAYLLYQHQSGFKVYYFDALDTSQGECALLVLP